MIATSPFLALLIGGIILITLGYYQPVGNPIRTIVSVSGVILIILAVVVLLQGSHIIF